MAPIQTQAIIHDAIKGIGSEKLLLCELMPSRVLLHVTIQHKYFFIASPMGNIEIYRRILIKRVLLYMNVVSKHTHSYDSIASIRSYYSCALSSRCPLSVFDGIF